MKIREAEDSLFSEWKKKYIEESFVIDGCPTPEVYLQEKRKVVFVLKDGNLGNPDFADSFENRTYNQRYELEHEPTLWWETIAKWCYFLKNNSDSWDCAENAIKDKSSIRKALSHHCIIQLKKTWGGGSVGNTTLAQVVVNDKFEILTQLSIYQPHFIVACGNGEHLAAVFDCKNSDKKRTSTGVGYWNVKLENNDCFLVLSQRCFVGLIGVRIAGFKSKFIRHF